MQTTVKLITTTQYPLETLYLTWQQSREIGEIVTAEELHAAARGYGPLAEEIEEHAKVMIQQHIPVLEMIEFYFLIEHMSVSLREQIVRHRVGHRFGPELGVDIVPGAIDSTYWSQSSRILDLSNFADDGNFLLPDEIKTEQVHIYKRAIQVAQDFYRQLVKKGMALEDARHVLPLATESRMLWKINLAALLHIIGKRGCWIAQLSLWRPIIYGMVDELCKKVSPIFRDVITPPCIKGDVFRGCLFSADNEARYSDKDPEPPCPLYHFLEKEWEEKDIPPEKKERFDMLWNEFGELWERDPMTGKSPFSNYR